MINKTKFLYLYVSLFLSCFSAISAHIHGGTFLAMAGKDTIVLAADSRFSSKQTGSLLIAEKKRQVFRVGSR